MKKILGIVLFVFIISCLNRKNDIKKTSDVYYFMFEKPLTNNPDSSKRSDNHKFVNDDFDDKVATNDELRNFNCLDSTIIRKRKRFLDSIKAALHYYDRRIVEKFYKRSYDSSICYTYKHAFTIDNDTAINLLKLIHNIGLDTTFIKEETFLDSISVINNGTFLEDGKSYTKLWKPTPYFLQGDTINVFVIERIPNTDSCIFRKVNRNLVPWL